MLTTIIILLLVVSIGLFVLRTRQFNRPRTIRWRIGNQVFTFQFPFKWMHVNSIHYVRDGLAMIGACVLGTLIVMAVLSFLFLLIGFLLPVVIIVGLIALILFLLFVV